MPLQPQELRRGMSDTPGSFTDVYLELILPGPPASSVSGGSDPSSASAPTSPSTLPSTISLGASTRRKNQAATSPSSRRPGDRYAWLLYAPLPSPPAVDDTSAVARFTKFGAEEPELLGSESSLWADDEDDGEGSGNLAGRGGLANLGKKSPAPKRPILLSDAQQKSNSTVVRLLSSAIPVLQPPVGDLPSIPFAFTTRRDPSSATSSTRPRRRGAPMVYLEEDRHRICTCSADYDDSSTTETDREEVSAVLVKPAPRPIATRSLFLRGAMIRCNGL